MGGIQFLLVVCLHISGPRYDHICKACLLRRSFWMITIIDKSAKNCIGGFSQNATRMDFGSGYAHIIMLRDCSIRIP